jgi:hypothetical protein
MNEQTNRRAMIRRMRAKSSLSYPEVFHRFCGYLRARARREFFFACAATRALSRGRRMNFPPRQIFFSLP